MVGMIASIGLLATTYLGACPGPEPDTPAWNGEEAKPRGKGWARPAPLSRVETSGESPHTGKACLRIDLNGDGFRAAGWNWYGWYPKDAGTDARPATHLTFWLMASRDDAPVLVKLRDNRDQTSPPVPIPALHTAWGEVAIPLSAFGDAIDLGRLWEIQFSTTSARDLTLRVDDIGFAARGVSRKSFETRVTVDPSRRLHAISPLIYGATSADPAGAKALGVTALRRGGARSSRYNWKAQADNAGQGWFFLNGSAGRWGDFLSANRREGLASYLTVPMLPWVARSAEGSGFSVAKYGLQQKAESFNADRGNGLKPDGSPVVGNDPSDCSVPSSPEFQAEGIRALPRGEGGTPTTYGLDHEPMAWHVIHRDVHPRPVTYEETLDRGIKLARAIKAADPRGLVAGPCSSGWIDIQFSAADAGADKFSKHLDRKAHGDVPFLAWYLGEMKAQEDREGGRRLLDLVDVHYFPQARVDDALVFLGKSHSPATRAMRVRSTRALWDPEYRDESWIGDRVMLIPRIRSWVAEKYPGTKLCIGEYGWGGDDDPSGAIAQAEILGVFAREQVDQAYLHDGLEGVQRFAFQLYRNPDGKGDGFGEGYLKAQSSTPDRVSAFAAARADGALTVILINKDLDAPAEVALDLGRPIGGGTLYRLDNPPGPIRRDPSYGDENAAKITLPPLSAVLLVQPAP